MPCPYYIMCVACAWFRQQIREIIPTKSSKTTICENLDPQKFSAIRYAISLLLLAHSGSNNRSVLNWLVYTNLVSRPHPAHVRRGLVSRVQILGLAPEVWSNQWNCRTALIEIMQKWEEVLLSYHSKYRVLQNLCNMQKCKRLLKWPALLLWTRCYFLQRYINR